MFTLPWLAQISTRRSGDIPAGNYMFRKSGDIPAGNYMFKVNNRNTRARCEICSKLTMNIFHTFSSVSIVNFEHVNVGWDWWLNVNILHVVVGQP